MESKALVVELKRDAHSLGFEACGIAGAEPLREEAARLETWLASGRHGTMGWMERNSEKRTDPKKLVPGAKTVVSVLQSYYHPTQYPERKDVGKISRYAWGDDYHKVMKEKLFTLLRRLDERAGPVNGRTFVDSAPVMDKVWAQRAGLGWIGKHTNLINRSLGSFFFIGELIIDLELPPDNPATDFCGSCTRCIEACPTDAIQPAYQLDARKCISYITIEHREDDIPDQLAASLEQWIFGCDICQDVCPWNKFKRITSESRYAPRPHLADTPLREWATIDEDTFDKRFAGSPVLRAQFDGFKRNVRIARSSTKDEEEKDGT